jgi:hypothetical protein
MIPRTRSPGALAAAAILLAAVAGVGRAAEPASPGFYRMKLVKIVDAKGFEKPLTAVTMLIPTDWTLRGEVKYELKTACTDDLVRVAFVAASPDGRTFVELFPSASWTWSDDPNSRQFMEQDRQMKSQFGMKSCAIAPPVTSRDFLAKQLLPRVRPGAKVVAAENDPEAQQALATGVGQLEAQMRQAGVNVQIRADTSRLRIAWDRQGQPEEEWVTGVTFARGMLAPAYDPMTGRIGQAMGYACGAEFLFGLGAPVGKLEANEKLFRAILGSVRVDPEWQGRVTQAQANIHAIQAKGAADRSRILSKSAEDIRRIQDETYQRRQESQDRISQKWSQTIRGVETFQNPGTGETVELSNRYGNAWSNGKGEYLLTDSPSFDPNVVLKENWTQLTPVEPGKPAR